MKEVIHHLLKGTVFKMTVFNAIIIYMCWDVFFQKNPFVISECDGIYSFKPCCIGERWDESLQRCAKCPRGWYGKNCSLECDIPYYGYRCSTGKCSCNKISCKIRSICTQMNDKEINDTKKREMQTSTTRSTTNTTSTSKTTKTTSTSKTTIITKTTSTSKTTITNAIEKLENTADPIKETGTTILSNATTTSEKENIIISKQLISSFAFSSLTLVLALLCCFIRAKLCYYCNSKTEIADSRVEYANNYMVSATMPVYGNLDDCRTYDIPHQNDCNSLGGSWKSSSLPQNHDNDYDDIANVMYA